MVIEVKPGGTAAAIGIEPNDTVTAINGTPIRSSDDLRTILAAAKLGDQVTVEFLRAGASKTVSGPLLERPRPANLAGELTAAKSELAALRALAKDKAKEPSLAEILQSLQDIDKRLPKAVAAFKKQYPNGEFDISIRIRITSDKDAKDPIEIGNVGPDDEKKPDAVKDAPKDAPHDPAPVAPAP
jgi:membrane-associated protease RseP (regulator of RpoE activity)